ncbi:hypothetical protein RYX45_24195, partial [Alkalihalophilus pseudofirmus]
YIKRLREMFPDASEHFYMTDPAELPEEEQLSFVSNVRATLAFLNAQLQLKKRNYPMSDLWWDVYNYYVKSPEKRQAQKVFS